MGSRPISLDIGLVLLVFGSSFGLAQIQHRLIQYPVIYWTATHPIRYIYHLYLIPHPRKSVFLRFF